MSDARGKRDSGPAWRAVVLVLVNILVAGLLLALLEGTASLLLTAGEIAATPAVPEQRHADPDTLLGWTNRPGVHLPDAYGLGIDVRINTQGFRADRDVSADVPPGTLRIICSGDSFTFGYGVGNADAWCQRLAALDPRLETVNMGLGGYGVDQAYLWYVRDGAALDHHVHLFAFLTDDFNRMKWDRFMGYGKPLLDLDGDSVVVVNRPVRPGSWLARRRALHGETLSRLAIVQLAGRFLRREADPDEVARTRAAEDAQVQRVAARIFADLDRINEAKGSRLFLVYFPGAWDYQSDRAASWRRFVHEEAERQGIPLLDLVDELRTVPPTEVEGLYAPNLHFSVAGNAWAARVLHRRLAPLLDSIAQNTSAPSPSVYGAHAGRDSALTVAR